MTVAFALAAAVAVVAIAALVLTTRKVAAERSHVHGLSDQLQGALEASAAAERRAEQDRLALTAAQEAAATAEHQAEHDRLALAGAKERAKTTSRQTVGEPATLASAGTLWELERLRLEREWADLAGATAPLPETWDGTIRPAIAIELELIREVIGVPTRLEPGDPPALLDPLDALNTTRITAEVLRRLARVGEEITVTFAPDGAIVMSVVTDGPRAEPDLAQLTAVAVQLHGELAVQPTEGGLEARVAFGGPHSTKQDGTEGPEGGQGRGG
jgi:hypothetical protein